MTALSLYAGVGFGVALDRMNIPEVGVEADPDVIKTRDAAGMITIGQNVWDWVLESMRLHYELLTAGPPCQPFSRVGRGEGRSSLGMLQSFIRRIGDGELTADSLLDEARARSIDERSILVVLPLFVILRDKPASIVLEQVPFVLPIWESYAEVLRLYGYSVWTGAVSAEAYGVPQTRRRAILLASRHKHVYPPAPTHSRYHVRSPERLDPGVLPWVSMADALGFPEGVVGFPRRYDGRDAGVQMDDGLYRARDFRVTERPAWGVTSKTRSWKRWGFVDRPAMTVLGHGSVSRGPTGQKRGIMNAIEAETFILREPFTLESARKPGDHGYIARGEVASIRDRYHSEAINFTIEEGAVLQTFPDNFPWRGNRNRQWETIGNAVPPLLAEHLIRAVL
jgi:DNA (cytosine-5)-methyltransferase 1